MSIFLEELKSNSKTFLLSKSVINITGEDAQSYLQSQTTNDVLRIENKGFQFNSILDISGKITSSFVLCKISENEFQIIVHDDFVKLTFDRIEKYHIAEEFEVLIQDKNCFVRTHNDNGDFKGQYFFERDSIIVTDDDLETDDIKLIQTLRTLSGVSEFGSEVLPGILINNTRFDELSVSYKKGCFPGQETVSKINTRRGAAFKPVLIKFDESFEMINGTKVFKDNKKIGEVKSSIIINDQTFLNIDLLRELRIDKSNLEMTIESKTIIGTIFYFPYLSPFSKNFAVELYDHAIDLFHNEKYQEAISYFEKAISVDPLFEDAYESLGVLYGRLENFDKAIELMAKLREINPKCMMALTNLSLYHMKLGNIETAEDFKGQATFLNFEVLGDEAEQKRREQEVKDKKLAERDKREGMFKQVIEMDPEDSMANNGMGEIEFERQNFEAAEKYFRTAIVGNERYSVAFLGLGKSLYQQNKLVEAKEILKHGIKVAGKNGDLMPANEMQTLITKLK
jgi:folate-binding protein YgfZ